MASGSTTGMAGCYNATSSSQLSVVVTSNSYIDHAICALTSDRSLIIIADYGAAHGRNSLRAMNMIIESLHKFNKIDKTQSILVVHNDLPTNNWLTLFEILHTENKFAYHGLASGRSFYEQCLPNNSVSIAYSTSSLHWLSQKPCNLENHCCSVYLPENDPGRVKFADQSRLDYERFLEYRSNELISGGVLILSIPSWDRSQASIASSPKHVHLLYQCAKTLLTSEELEKYTIPVHVRWYDECVDTALLRQYSFELIKAEHIVIDSPLMQRMKEGDITLEEFAKEQTLLMRSWTDSTLQSALELNLEKEKLTTRFWNMYEEQVRQQPEMHFSPMRTTYLILKKK